MILRELNLEELKRLHDTELREAFPPTELKPFAAMETLYRKGVYHPVSAWEGEELMGYALLWDAPGRRYVLIDYLGVPAAKRNGGLGTAILKALADDFSALDGILVESEAPEGVPEDGLRRRRMAFYRRAGFSFLDYECVLFGVRYAVCLLAPNGKGRAAEAMEAHKAVYRSQFPERVYRQYIQIPRDPDHPLAPPASWAEQENLPGLGEGREEL